MIGRAGGGEEIFNGERLPQRALSARSMPKAQNPDSGVRRFNPVDDEIHAYRKESGPRSLNHHDSRLRSICQRFCFIDERKTDSLRRRRIVPGDEFYDSLNILLAAQGKDYLPAHERTARRRSSAEHPRP
jgi:hypothetical protein